jgi:SRSO17 transposase
VPLPPRPKGKMGRPPRLLQRDKLHQPLTAKQPALCLSATDLHKVSWREGTRGMIRSRFAAIRVRVAHRDDWRKEPHPEQWLLIEWPAEEKQPTKYWLSNLNASISLRKWVTIAKLRWRIERDYEQLKQELGLGILKVRTGAGFIIMQRYRLQLTASWFWSGPFPPSAKSRPVEAANIQAQISPLQSDYTPRGATRKNRTA